MQKFTKKILQRLKRFRKNKSSNLNTFIVCLAVIMVWRGIWGILDLYIFPNSPLTSCIICIIIGLAILLIDDGKINELE